MQSLKTGSSSSIYLCGYINSGTYELEQQLHKRFHCKQGEWFYPDGLVDYINNNSDMMAEVAIEQGMIYVYKKMKIVN